MSSLEHNPDRHLQPSRQKGYKPLHVRSQTIVAPNASFVTPTDLLAELMEERIKHLGRTRFRGDAFSGKEEGAGAIAYICHAAVAASHETMCFDQVSRRLSAIRNLDTRACDIRMADALLFGADVNIEDTDLPTLPAGPEAAREAVSVHRELVDPEMDDLAAKRLEHSLVHFAQGFVHEFNLIDQHVCRGLEALFTLAASTPTEQRQLVLV